MQQPALRAEPLRYIVRDELENVNIWLLADSMCSGNKQTHYDALILIVIIISRLCTVRIFVDFIYTVRCSHDAATST